MQTRQTSTAEFRHAALIYGHYVFRLRRSQQKLAFAAVAGWLLAVVGWIAAFAMGAACR